MGIRQERLDNIAIHSTRAEYYLSLVKVGLPLSVLPIMQSVDSAIWLA